MTATCFRCDWEAETEAAACPRCGAPLYRPAPRLPEPRAAARPPPSGAAGGPRSGGEPVLPADERAPSEGRSATTSPRSVFVTVFVVFVVILVLLSRGGSGPGPSPVAPSPSPPGGSNGLLVYAAPDGGGSVRLWRWNLVSGEVAEGPVVRDPLELVNVRSPSYGWLGLTSDLGNGVYEASVLDSLDPGARAEPIGRGGIVTWARQGATAVLVDRGPRLEGCRREVSVIAVHVERPGRERVVHDTICGEVLSVGRTTLGYFLTRRGPDGAEIVGAGYASAGVLLPDHGLIAVTPGGDMLVTPEADLLAAKLPPLQGGSARDVAPIPVAGRVWFYSQFSGPPVPYLVDGAPLRVDRVLAYGPGAGIALVVGRVGEEPPGVWELPLVVTGDGSTAPRSIGPAHGITAAAYANDGTAYVVNGGRLYRLRDHVLRLLDVPEGAPGPAGPLAWIVREPITEL